MRFSSLFQLPASEPMRGVDAPGAAEASPIPATREPAVPELPDDLDARVRMVGEWQLGEA